MKKKKKIKFFTLYDTFTEEERKQFKLFLSSPLFNQGRKYIKILSYIESDRTVVFEFGNTKKEQTLWNRLSELTKLAERFLVIKASETETFEYRTLLLSELKKRNLNDHFEKQIIDLKSKLKDNLLTEMNIEEYLTICEKYLEHLKSIPDLPGFEEHFRETNNYKFAFFILEFLDCLIQLWEMKTSKSITSKNFLEDILLNFDFEKILSFIKEKVNDLFPFAAFYYYVLCSLREPLNNKHYGNAKKIFEKELKLIPEEYRVKLYRNMMDYNLVVLNMGEHSARTELFNVMNKKLKEGLCGDIQDRDFARNKFRDYVLVSLDLGKFNWTEKFINKYGPKLPAEFREDNVNLGKAQLMFRKKEYQDCKEILKNVTKENPFHYIDASILKLKVSYELNEIDNCHQELRRLTGYLRKEHMVQEDLIKYSKKFCKAYILLLKLNQDSIEKNLTNLEFELSSGTRIGEKWIKEKIKELNVV